MPKWNFRNPVAKFDIDPKIYTRQVWFCTETVKNLHTQLRSNKKATNLMHLRCFFLSKNSRNVRTLSV